MMFRYLFIAATVLGSHASAVAAEKRLRFEVSILHVPCEMVQAWNNIKKLDPADSPGGKIERLREAMAKQRPGNEPLFPKNDVAEMFVQDTVADPKVKQHAFPSLTMDNSQSATMELGKARQFLTQLGISTHNDLQAFVPEGKKIFLGTRLTLTGVERNDGIEVAVKGQTTQLRQRTKLHPVTIMVEPVFADGNKAESVPFTQYMEQPFLQTLEFQKKVTIPIDSTMMLAIGELTMVERSNWVELLVKSFDDAEEALENVGYSQVRYHTFLILKPTLLAEADTAVDPSKKTVAEMETVAPRPPSAAILQTGAISSCDCGPPSGASVGFTKAPPLTVADLIKLTKNGVVEKVIIQRIKSSEAGKPLTVADIIRLSASGVSDDIISVHYHATRSMLRLSPDDLIELKKNSVSDVVVLDILDK